MDEHWFEDVQEALHEAHGFDAYSKFRSYGRADSSDPDRWQALSPSPAPRWQPTFEDMRGKREEHGGNHRDILEGIPDFSMHIIRSTMGDYILDQTELPPGTASLMIAHEIPVDHRSQMDKVEDTGRRWYFQAQRIPEKLNAMELRSEALLKASDEAGGSILNRENRRTFSS